MMNENWDEWRARTNEGRCPFMCDCEGGEDGDTRSANVFDNPVRLREEPESLDTRALRLLHEERDILLAQVEEIESAILRIGRRSRA